ncbi:hypothetical protein AB0M02_08115 [Actinoplanes sp. NPDC051861]|uniref:hypothetical protein n=1 Tax=Actinoplanes sp. NPDC051861 TaxID=3155170 RepID=UPI0034373D7E
MLPRQPVLDPAVAYPTIATLRAALDAGDWPAARAVIDTAAPVERTLLLRACADREGTEEFLRGVLTADPADSAAAVLLAQRLMAVSWAARVRRKRGTPFREQLVEAESILVASVSRTPEDLAAWTARLTSARGLELGLPEARRRYDRLAELDACHLPAQSELLQQLTPRWGGTWPDAHTFARAATDAAPLGSHNAVLIAEAHLEQALGEGGGTASGARRHLASTPVLAEVSEAAARSVQHPEFRRTAGWVQVLNTFAMTFCLAGELRTAKTLFDALDGLGTEYPWHYLGDSAAGVIRSYRIRTVFTRGAPVGGDR